MRAKVDNRKVKGVGVPAKWKERLSLVSVIKGGLCKRQLCSQTAFVPTTLSQQANRSKQLSAPILFQYFFVPVHIRSSHTISSLPLPNLGTRAVWFRTLSQVQSRQDFKSPDYFDLLNPWDSGGYRVIWAWIAAPGD